MNWLSDLYQLLHDPKPRRRTRRGSLAPAAEVLEARICLSGTAPVVDLSGLVVDTDAYAADKVLLELHDGTQAGDVAGVVDGARFEQIGAVFSNFYEVHLPEDVTPEEAMRAYGQHVGVVLVEPDYHIHLEVTPNDPAYGSLYGMERISAPTAWETTTGSSSTIIAVIDTGVDYTHADLAGNMWVNPGEIAGNGIDDDGNGFVDDVHGYDFANNDGDPMDDNNHGTHVAGTIGAVGNNGTGVAGVNWDVQIMALKFLSGSGSGSTSNAVRALDYAVMMGATISNNSWGGGGSSSSLSNAIEAARLADHVFVAAAGNSATNNDVSPHYPSNYTHDNVVSVASTDSADNLSSFSNYGATTVDLAAPGSGIYSTIAGGGYATFSGTSMATPHVAGVIGLVRSLHPDWNYQQVIDQVLNTVDPIASLSGRVATGGRLNAAAAVGDGTPPPDTVGPRVVSSTPSGLQLADVTSVTVTFDEPLDTASLSLADFSVTGPSGPLTLGSLTVLTPNTVRLAVTGANEAGNYTIRVGPQITDTAGNLMDQDRDGTGGEAVDDRYASTFTISDREVFANNSTTNLRDDGVATISTIDVGVDVLVEDLDVLFDATHTWDSDLDVFLTSPSGTTVELFTDVGGSGDNFSGTILDDEAGTAITSGTAPFTGSFRPEGLLSAFDGENARGTWTLTVSDDYAFLDTGTLNGWALLVDGTEVLSADVLFDEGFYLRTNPDVAAAVARGDFSSGRAHFDAHGEREGRNPSVFFDSAFYLRTNLDVAAAVAAGGLRSGLQHFVLYGANEGRRPSAVFDSRFYARAHADVVDGPLGSAMLHYARFGHAAGEVPSAVYDESFYLAANPDIGAAVARGDFGSGLEHYVRYGHREQRASSALFDEQVYLRANPDVAAAVAQGAFAGGVEHFVRYGRFEGRVSSAGFDPAYYLQNNPDAAAAVSGGAYQSALEHYVLVGRGEERRGSIGYDEGYYLDQNPDVRAAVDRGEFDSGLSHFLLYGHVEGRATSVDYDESVYLQANPDVAAAVAAGAFRSGLEHFQLYGRFEGRIAT